LCRNGTSGRAFVKHRANASSGGHETDIEIDDFLSRGPHTPEHQALLHLIEDGALTPPKAVRPKRASKGTNSKSRKRSAG
jgi:hypothetical protein